jgi:hypothetical protein
MDRLSTSEIPRSTGLPEPSSSRPGFSVFPSVLAEVASTETRLSRRHVIRKAVLLTLLDPRFEHLEQFRTLSPADWRNLLAWLDVSGLALYFFDHVEQLGCRDLLPRAVASRWQQNSDDNTARTRGMIDESIAIQRGFQNVGIVYAVMKGASLLGCGVPRLELRHQFDLDYLVSPTSASEARRILEARGYRLRAISGNTWEFKINETPHVRAKDLYKNLPYRGVELHLEPCSSIDSSRLDRVQTKELFGIFMPVLSPVDLFLGQAMHIFKDVRAGFSRAAHFLELHRHVLARGDDHLFWCELRTRIETDSRLRFGFSLVAYFMSSIVGHGASETLKPSSLDLLPVATRLWVDRYGHRVLFGNPPGTKLYMLLENELRAGATSHKPSRDVFILPLRPPPAVIRSSADEPLRTRIARYRIQLCFLVSRLRFHTIEGIRYAFESGRWRRHLERHSS